MTAPINYNTKAGLSILPISPVEGLERLVPQGSDVPENEVSGIESGSQLSEIKPLDGSPSQPTGFQEVIKMIGLLLSMVVSQGNLSTSTLQNQNKIIDAIKKSLTTLQNEQIAEIEQQQAQQAEAASKSLWARIGMDILGAVLTIATFAFAGPVAGVLVATMFILSSVQESNNKSIMTNLFESLPGSSLEQAILGTIIVIVTTLAAGGLAAAIDTILSEEGGEAAATSVTSAVEAGGTEAATTAAEEGTAASAASATATSTVSTTMKLVALQLLISSGVIQEFVTAAVQPGDDPKKKEEVEWITLGITLAIALAGGLASTKAGGALVNSLMERLPSISDTALGRSVSSALSNISVATAGSSTVVTIRNILSVLSKIATSGLGQMVYTSGALTGGGLNTTMKILLSKIQEVQAANKTAQGETTGNIEVFNILNQQIQQQMKLGSEQMVEDLRGLESSFDHFDDVTKNGRYVAELFG